MKKIEGKIEVYHAGTEVIEKPDCKVGRKNLDFGPGFYLTDNYDQAVNFARSKSRDRNLPPIINTYLLDKESMLRDSRWKIFDQYDEDWLEYIVNCRTGKKSWMDYDYVEGGVADDRVIDTVNLYIQDFVSKERALQNLRYLKPNNQICIINQDLLNLHLKFTNSIILPDNGVL